MGQTLGNPRRMKWTWCVVLVVLLGGLWLVLSTVTIYPAPAGSALARYNLSHISIAMQIYMEDYDGRFPPEMSTNEQIKRFLKDYSKNDAVFETINPDGSELLGNGLLAGSKASSLYGHETTVTLYDSKIWKEKGLRNVAFMDGHVKFVDEDDFLFGLRAEYLNSDVPVVTFEDEAIK